MPRETTGGSECAMRKRQNMTPTANRSGTRSARIAPGLKPRFGRPGAGSHWMKRALFYATGTLSCGIRNRCAEATSGDSFITRNRIATLCAKMRHRSRVISLLCCFWRKLVSMFEDKVDRDELEKMPAEYQEL